MTFNSTIKKYCVQGFVFESNWITKNIRILKTPGSHTMVELYSAFNEFSKIDSLKYQQWSLAH